MARNRGYTARIRGSSLFAPECSKIYWSVVTGQPLVLEREPGNPVDPNAIVVADLMGRGFCYVERLVAAELAPLMDAGRLPLAKVLSPPSRRRGETVYARATIWFDGTEDDEEITIREKENA